MFQFLRDDDRPRQEKQEASSSKLFQVIQENAGKEIIFLCIGTDRVIADSLGPLVGSMLKERKIPFRIFGTLEAPVHALNIEKAISDIQSHFSNACIIAVDASVGDKQEVGKVYLEKGPIFPGRAMNKLLPQVGDYQIKGVVTYSDVFTRPKYLNHTRLFKVITMAEQIAGMIAEAAGVEKNDRETFYM